MEPKPDAVTIAALPGEVLAHIFKSGAQSSSGCLPCLFKFSAVSQQWRSAALDYPDLWSTITVPLEPALRNLVALVRITLERSKSCLFDFTLEVPRTADMDVVTSVMLLVIQHVHRLRRLAIRGRPPISDTSAFPNTDEISALLQNAQRAPRLAILELIFPNPSPVVSMGTPGRLLLQAPSLVSLRIHGVTSPVPFVGLRSLAIEGLRTSHAEFRDMVVASPLLTELILPKLRLTVDLQSQQLDPIEIPALKVLALSFSKPPPSNAFNSCHNLLSLISVPNVEYLELAGSDIPDLSRSFQNPSAFIRLRTLRLVNITIIGRNDEVDNRDYLRALTTIEELELIHSHAEYLIPTENTAKEKPRHRTRSISREIRFRQSYWPRPGPQRQGDDPLERAEAAAAASSSSTNSVLIYSNLRSVSLNTLLAAEAAWLYHLVLERPDIQMVKLSPMTERHLVASLGLVDGVVQPVPTAAWTKRVDTPEVQSHDVLKLLRERVEIIRGIEDGRIAI
ncbi:hypothetical protein R3P38DRAFT_2969888 [Favolaschia claudopus]|uniref:F-box domain-containing protein n=1 Tax=Favolaschia claudopus TaxID=2862362 RepID=A0AAW0B6C9_9AGAR